MQRLIPMLLLVGAIPAIAGTREEVEHRSVVYHVYRCDHGEVRIFWKDADGDAEFFRSQGCRDALFLDGDLSLMWTPEDGAPRAINNFGAIFGVTEKSDP